MVLAALTFTRYETKLSQIVRLLENRDLNPGVFKEPQLPEQLARFKLKDEKTTTPQTPPTPTEDVEQTFHKLTRHEDRTQDEKK